jgi:perosamine synthetase
MRIPLSAPDIQESDIEAVCRVLRSPNLSLGPKLEEFERSIAEYTGVSDAIAVNSGTSGLHLCIRALGIGEGDEVIVPSFTFIAAANAIRYERAQPVFVDIEPQTLNLDPTKIEEAITPRTRAILAVHTFGCPAEMSSILEIARARGLATIEDACEAIGAEYDGRKVGAIGDAGVFAFYPNKQITTGEGGAIVTGNSKLAGRLRSLRNHGRNSSSDWFDCSELGYNYRISDLNCALGVEQMKRIGSVLERRESVARSYAKRLSGNPSLVLPALSVPRRRISWFVYVVRLSGRYDRSHRDRIWQEMRSRGIGCGRYFAPIHLQPTYRNAEASAGGADLFHTEAIADRVLALPFFNRITETQIDEVSGTLEEILRGIEPLA